MQMLAVKFYMEMMSLCAYQRVLKGMITWNLLLIEFLQNTNAYSESLDLSPSTIFIPPLDCRTLESLASKTNTVHPWLSEPLWSGDCLNKWTLLHNWNYSKCKYQQHHYTLYVLLHVYCSITCSTSMNTVSVKKILNNILVVETQITLQDSHHHLVQVNRHCSQIRTIAMFYLLSK